MLPLSLVVLILMYHWVADFMFQSDWMARNKSSDDVPLVAHIGVYTFVFIWLGLLFAGIPGLVWALVNGVAHFFTDWATSRITSYLWKKKDVHSFFVVIGLDQLLHYVVLFYTATIFLT
jgi:hypothetical protein